MTTPLSAATAAAPTAPSAGDALAGLDGRAFLQLLVAQLRYQNPMAPSDPAAMLQQTAQLRQVETLQQLSTTQQQLSRMQEASMAAGLVGKHVDAAGADGLAISGIVEAVRFTGQGPMLIVGDRQVPFADTLAISAPPTTTPATSTG